MTKLEELINELCPDGVEYKTIGEVCTIKKGVQLNKDKLKDNGLYPVINGGVNPSGYWDEYNFNANLITISQGGASAGYVNYMTTPFWAGAHCYVVEKCEECLNYTYLYHFIKMHQKTFMQCQYGAGIPSLSLKSINSIRIPLPPLSIQSEIVHILDSFTLLTAELTAELTARQKQYAFYRDYLLDFSNEDVTKKIPDIDCSNVEYKKLGDIATAIYRGAGIKRDEVTETGIPCVRYGEIYTTYNVTFNDCVSHTDEDKIQNKKYFEHGDVLFAITGESVEEIAKSCVYFGHDKCLAGGDVVVLKHNQNPKYMAYVLSTTNAQKQKSKGKVKSKVVHSSVPAISDIVIPLPPLAEQEKIANMIERFDYLCNDISTGLPVEIEARKKQYEYYRDTLLSFDDKACSHIVKVERERELTRSKAIKWLELQDVLKIKNGKDYKSFNIGNYPVYGSGGVMAYVDTFAYDKPSVLIPRKGSIDKLYYVDVPFWNVDTIFYTDVNNEIVLTKYVYYWLQKEHLEKLNTAGGVPSLTQTVLNKVKIAVPPLEEQERIVSILDRFDKLCNDISEGLPAEIEARQKQYEYYRDKLLTFKETGYEKSR